VKKLHEERCIFKKLNEIEISKTFVTLKNLGANVERITQAIKAAVKGV